MKTRVLVLAVALLGCGDDSLDNISACNEFQDVICTKIWECIPRDQINKDVAGTSLADCKVKLQGMNCTKSMAACEAGTKFQADNARTCIDMYASYSCKDFTSDPPSPAPAICSQVCK